ncbi:TPA: type IV pilus biogenesis protein PilP, partial [Escherichia coli]|nr:type IV pilus biogenesis protein PilP [Escherichia coli]HCO0293389.1 type IV pilus biogenesis protein PilP [Escherichia coli]
IFGIQPQLSARVILPGGTETDVRAGQALPGTLFMVEQITPDSVILEYNGNRQTLRP